MADEAYQASLAITGATRLELRAGAALTIEVVITNRSPVAWSASECGVIRAGNHWLDGSGERMLRRDDGRNSLPGMLAAGETCRVALGITAPDVDGEFVCEIDLAHEGVLWFHDKGSPTARFPVRVGSPSHPSDSRGTVRPQAALREPERTIDYAAFTEQFAGGGGEPGEFPMHGIERTEVVEAIERLGGRLIHIEDDHSCGEEWVSFRYYVTTR